MDACVTRWWWVRHAPVTANNGRIYGQGDLPCDCTDLEAFKGLARMLPEDAVLMTTPLQRTAQTAAGIANGGLSMADPIVVDEFKEQSFGDWQGLTYEDFAELRDGLAHRYWLTPAYERAPNGESFADLVARVAPAITRETAAHAGRDIIAVTHGGTIRAALAFALGMGAENVLSFSVDNLSVTRLDHIQTPEHTSWRIARVNRPPRDGYTHGAFLQPAERKS